MDMTEVLGRLQPARLLTLSSEIRLLAEVLSPPDPRPSVSADAVRKIIRARRARARFLPGDLFADPAWDMMLDLFAARLEGRKVSVTSLCIAANVPPTTALRWIQVLCERGLFVRSADERDARRVLVDLSDDAAERMAAFFASVPHEEPAVV